MEQVRLGKVPQNVQPQTPQFSEILKHLQETQSLQHQQQPQPSQLSQLLKHLEKQQPQPPQDAQHQKLPQYSLDIQPTQQSQKRKALQKRKSPQVPLQPQPTSIHYLDEPVILDCIHQKIRVSVAIIDGEIRAVGCNLMGAHNLIPDLETRQQQNYSTRALIHDNIRCVVYIAENGVVLGAKLPPSSSDAFQKGK